MSSLRLCVDCIAVVTQNARVLENIHKLHKTLVQGINPIHALEDLHHLVAEANIIARLATKYFDLFSFGLDSFALLRHVAALPGCVSVMPMP